MADRSIVVRLKAEVAGFKANIGSARKSLDDLTKADIKKPAEAFEGFANKAAIGAGVIALGIGKAVKSFSDFDTAMSAAGAATNTAASEMGELRELALKLGADTQFSATEAAEGITEMAKAGVSAADIMNGGLAGGLDLAAAGQLDVARASEIAATALTQFNLQGSEVSHVADLYAAAAGKAQGSVEDIAQAMKFAGVTASSMGISIEETTGVLGLFASKGIIGEQAGTSFRSMLLSLTAPSKLAKNTMEEYGISVFDAAGNFIGLEGAAQELKTQLGPLDQATRTAALGQIFGNESIGAAIALYDAGAAGVQDWTDKVNDAGFAQEQAAKLTDNLTGDIERLGGSLDTVFIQTGSGANGVMRGLVQTLEAGVDWLGKIPAPILLVGAGLSSLALLLPKGILMWRQYGANLDSVGLSIDKIGKKAPKIATGLRIMQGAMAGFAAAAAAGAVTNALTTISELNIDTAKLKAGADAIDVINERLRATSDLGAPVADTLDNLDDVLQATFAPGRGQQIDNFFAGINSAFGFENVSDITIASQRLGELDTVLAGLAAGGNAAGAKAAFDQIAAAAALQGISVDELKEKFPQYREALNAAGAQAEKTATKTGVMTQETDRLEKAASDAETALSDLQDAILGLGDPVARQRAATRDYEGAIDDAKDGLKEYKDELIKQRIEAGYSESSAKKWAQAQIDAGKALDINTEAGRQNQARLDALAQATLEKVAADFAVKQSTDGVEAATKLASETMKKGREDFIKAAEAAGMTKDEAKKLADQLGLVPENVDIAVKQTGAAEAEQEIDRAARARTAVITVKTKDGGSYRYTQGNGPNRPAAGGGFQEFSYDSGGYTGNISPKAIAGVVHGDEQVIKSPSRRRFEALHPGVLDYINRHGTMPRGYADGGRVGASLPVSSMPSAVRLDASDIARALSAAGNTFNMYGPDPAQLAKEVEDRLNWQVMSGGR